MRTVRNRLADGDDRARLLRCQYVHSPQPERANVVAPGGIAGPAADPAPAARAASARKTATGDPNPKERICKNIISSGPGH
jgi:hypothetical protein